MTADEIQKVINSIQYKPNVIFVCDFEFEFCIFGIMLKTIDVFSGKPTTISHQNRFRISDMFSKDHFIRYIKERIRIMELHEMDEFLTINGERLSDPHHNERIINDNRHSL